MLFRSTVKRSNQSILKEISSECSLEGLMLKPKLQYFGSLMQRTTAAAKSLQSCPTPFDTPWSAACQACLSLTISWSLRKLMSIESVTPSNHLILCHPLLLPPSIFRSIRVFSKESVLHIRWPKYWTFSLNISPSNEYSGLISFRIDWFDLLAVQGTL